MSPVYISLNAIEWASARWTDAMLRATLEGALVLALLWLLLRLLPKIPPSVQCWLWRAAYGKMLISLFCAATITLHALPATLAADQVDPNVSRAGSLRSDHGLAVNASRPRLHIPGIADSLATEPVLNARTHPTRAKITWGQIGSACFVVWCIGVVICLALMARACRRARRLRRNVLPLLDPAAIDSLARVCRKTAIDQSPELLSSCEIDTPLLVGICRPAILVPAELISQASRDEFRAMLAHEVEHMRRRDLLWNWLTAATNVLFFFHPLVWLARRELALTSETACDAAAVAGTGTSVGAYLAMVLRIASGRHELPQLGFAAASIVESYKTLQRRFLIMKSSSVQSARGRAIWGVATIVLSIVGILPWRIAPRAAAASQGDRPAPPSAIDASSTKPADKLQWPIKSLKDITGKWSGAKDGVGVELQFDDTRPGNFPATLTIKFTRSSTPQVPGETSVIQVSKSADLRCKIDEKRGELHLYLPAYLGQDKAIKQSSWNGKTPVAQVRRSSEKAIELRIIPSGYDNPSAHDYDFPAVDHLILRPAAKPPAPKE